MDPPSANALDSKTFSLARLSFILGVLAVCQPYCDLVTFTHSDWLLFIYNHIRWSFQLCSSILCYGGLPFGLASIITGINALTRIKMSVQKQGRGLAILGIVLGALEVVLVALDILYFATLGPNSS